MESRDFLKKQIDQVAQALGQMLNDFLGNSPVRKTEGIKQAFTEKLNLDFQELLLLTPEELKTHLIDEKKWSDTAIEHLADLFFSLSNESNSGALNKVYAEKALALYEYLYKQQKSFSFEWLTKINILKMAVKKG